MNEKINKVKPRTLTGFMELLPNDQILFNSMRDTIKNSYEKFGFLPLDTPIIELSEVLLAKAGGETEKQIYRFKKGDNDLALRFDLTVPLAKYVAMNYSEITFPFKRYQIGKVYRGEKPQKGRFREFYQCDIDIIGDGELNILNDAEIPSIIYNTFKQLGFDEFTININNRKILNGLFEELDLKESSTDVLRIIDKIDKIGKDSVISELMNIGVPEKSIEFIMNFISIEGTNLEQIERLKSLNIKNDTFKEGVIELESVTNYIDILNVPKNYYKINLKIARGLDYYTGTVYETFLDEYPQIGSVCSGGRYDNLAEFYTDKKLPGVGISIGLTRLFYKLNELNVIDAKKTSISDAIVIPMSDNIEYALNIATKLRDSNINTEFYSSNKKIKAKLKYADKLNIPFSIIIGEDEIKENVIMVKDMKNSSQMKMTVEEFIKYFNENRAK